MEWKKLLSEERSRNTGKIKSDYKSADLRSEFEKDYHRIIGSASFRRLQDKTQVFPLDKSDFIRTRLTHSLEVSSFAKSLAQNIGANILTYKKDSSFTPRMKEDICNIVQCAGLIHDIGNYTGELGMILRIHQLKSSICAFQKNFITNSLFKKCQFVCFRFYFFKKPKLILVSLTTTPNQII